MTTTREPLSAIDSRSLLLPYALVLSASVLSIQVIIALTGGDITLLAGVLTGLVGAGILVWVWRHYRALTHVRFGLVLAHVIAFMAVTTSFNLHAVIQTVSLSSAEGGFESAAENLLSTSWFGATLLMSAAWGLGLSAHLVGSVLGRGWEE